MKKWTILIALTGLLTLSGCQLAQEPGTTTTKDQLVGVFLTTEYLDTIDMEAYLNDHLDEVVNGETIVVEGDTREYEDRIYAVDVSEDPLHPDYQFPGLEGIAIYCVPVPTDEDDYCWTPSRAPEAWLHNAYTSTDDGEEVVLTAELYVSTAQRHHEFYGNPMYRTPDGEIYLLGGTGISGNMDQPGTSMSQTLEETSTMTVGEETTQQRCEVNVTVTSVDPMEKTVLVQMDANNQVMARQEFLPGQAPEEFTPEGSTAYLVVESHRVDKAGEKTVDRALFDRDDETLQTYQEGNIGFFCRMDTTILWPE